MAYVVGGLDKRISIFIGGYRLFAKGRMNKVVIIFFFNEFLFSYTVHARVSADSSAISVFKSIFKNVYYSK